MNGLNHQFMLQIVKNGPEKFHGLGVKNYPIGFVYWAIKAHAVETLCKIVSWTRTTKLNKTLQVWNYRDSNHPSWSGKNSSKKQQV